jgi:hypothetical protein
MKFSRILTVVTFVDYVSTLINKPEDVVKISDAVQTVTIFKYMSDVPY